MLKEDFIDKHKRSNDYKNRRNGVVFFLYIYNHEYSVRTNLHISQLIFKILKLKTRKTSR